MTSQNPIIQLQKSRKNVRDVHHMPRWMRESRANQLTGKKKKAREKKRKEQKIANAANPSRATLWSLL